ncbi:MAG: hypothetical protein LH650_09970 [Chloroflexi bacterium]|nr:hypothetical protein [Chloroflexota bacterium]
MRRTLWALTLCVMLVATIGPLGAEAKGSSRGAPTFSATGGTGPAGGVLPVSARVQNAAAGSTFAAIAVVHFASGDVSWDLVSNTQVSAAGAKSAARRDGDRRVRPHHRRRHHPPTPPRPGGVELTASAQVPITGEESWGPVAIDVTITYGTQVVQVSTTGLVDGY